MTFEAFGHQLPLAVLLYEGMALLLAVVVMAVVMAYHAGERHEYRREAAPGHARELARAVINECMGTDTTAPVPPEPAVGARVVTAEGHPWVRTTEGPWESEEAPHVVASWQVLAGMRVRVIFTPRRNLMSNPMFETGVWRSASQRLSATLATSRAAAATHAELDDFLADPEGYAGAES